MDVLIGDTHTKKMDIITRHTKKCRFIDQTANFSYHKQPTFSCYTNFPKFLYIFTHPSLT